MFLLWDGSHFKKSWYPRGTRPNRGRSLPVARERSSCSTAWEREPQSFLRRFGLVLRDQRRTRSLPFARNGAKPGECTRRHLYALGAYAKCRSSSQFRSDVHSPTQYDERICTKPVALLSCLAWVYLSYKCYYSRVRSMIYGS